MQRRVSKSTMPWKRRSRLTYKEVRRLSGDGRHDPAEDFGVQVGVDEPVARREAGALFADQVDGIGERWLATEAGRVATLHET